MENNQNKMSTPTAEVIDQAADQLALIIYQTIVAKHAKKHHKDKDKKDEN